MEMASTEITKNQRDIDQRFHTKMPREFIPTIQRIAVKKTGEKHKITITFFQIVKRKRKIRDKTKNSKNQTSEA